MSMVGRSASLRLLVCVVCLVEAGGTVLDLTNANFDKTVKQHPLVFVQFYAPWCGHCKKLVPEWEKVSDLVADDAVVAKVDTIAEEKLGKEHGVESFPTLLLFRGHPKVSVTYTGPRTADKFAEWVKEWSKAVIVQRLQSDSTKAFTEKKTISILGFERGDEAEDSAMLSLLESVGFMLNPMGAGLQVPVRITAVKPSELGGLDGFAEATKQIGSAFIAMVRDFEFGEKHVIIFLPKDGFQKTTVEVFLKWVQGNRIPSLIPAKEDTEQFFLQDVVPGNGLVMYFGEDSSVRRGLNKLAARYAESEKRLKWVHATPNDFGESLGNNVGLVKANMPEIVIWTFGESEDKDQVFRLSQQSFGSEMTVEGADKLVQSWQAGELSAEADPVVALTSDSFEDIVIKVKKDVLVEFYAPWCGHCKALTPVYKELAKHYRLDEGISICKMDATQHEHRSADVKSYPTIKFYPKGKKRKELSDRRSFPGQSRCEEPHRLRRGESKNGAPRRQEQGQSHGREKEDDG